MKRTAALIFLLAAFSFAAVVIVGQQQAVDQLANIVGVGARVEANPYNTAAQQLAQREAELDERERELKATQELTDILAVSVGAIAALLGLNYYMDWRRNRGMT